MAFLALAFVSGFWSNSNLWQTSMFTYLQLAMWVILLMDLIASFQYLERALFWVFIGTLAGALLAIYQFYTQGQSWQYSQRGGGGFDDPNYSSASFMFILPYVFYRIRYDRGLLKVIWLISALVLLSGVAFTVSRTGLLAILIFLAGQYILYPNKETRAKFVFLVVILVLISMPFWPWDNISYRFSIAWSGGNDQDLGQRIAGLRYGWRIFTQNPLTGHGIGYLPGQDVIHNAFLGVAVQLGIFGFLVMLWLWLTTWRSLYSAYAHAKTSLNDKHLSLISAVQLSAMLYFFFSLSLATESSRPLWLLFALGGICFELVKEKQVEQTKHSKNLAQQVAHAG
jgi:O-antigen ligase